MWVKQESGSKQGQGVVLFSSLGLLWHRPAAFGFLCLCIDSAVLGLLCLCINCSNGEVLLFLKVALRLLRHALDDYSYDLLVCSQVVEHVPDPSALVKKTYQSCKHQSSLFLFTGPTAAKHAIMWQMKLATLCCWNGASGINQFILLLCGKKEREIPKKWIIVVFQPNEK